MSNLEITNSSLTITLTMQIWQPDSFGIFLDSLLKRGFNLTQDQSIRYVAYKLPISSVGLDYPSRRVFIQITNNVSNPHENLNELLSVLSDIGYSEESIERIDINGNIFLKVKDGLASTFVQAIVRDEFTKKASAIFEESIKSIGLRIISEEPFFGDLKKCPFSILIEPLVTDSTDTKFFVSLTSSSKDIHMSIHLLESLYERLMKLILAMKNG